MYDSESNGKSTVHEVGGKFDISKVCKRPPDQFRINFQPVNDYMNGIYPGITVDGILCISDVVAKELCEKRIDEIMAQWITYIKHNK